MKRRRVALIAAPVVVFLAVTFGLRPLVNLIARIRSPHLYSQYDVSGTWVAGLIAAAVTTVIGLLIARRLGAGKQ
jgi:hypothetical protein